MIYLYRDILPNYDNNTHIMYNNIDDYIAYLGAPYLSFEENRYTLNGNIAEVTIGLKTDIDHITYIAWNNNGMWRFYHVLSAVNQSGYAIFNLDVDLWGTFISYAQFSKIRVSRCNRNIGTGIYDPIAATAGAYTLTPIGEHKSINDFVIVYVVAYATGLSSIASNGAGTAIQVFANDIVDFEGRPEGSLLDWYIGAVSGVYSLKANILSEVVDLDANVLKAYLIPASAITPSLEPVPVFNFINDHDKGTLTPNYVLRPLVKRTTYSIEIDPEYTYRVGTKDTGLDIIRTTENTLIYYNIYQKQDGLQIVVQQGTRTLDITSAFEIGLTRNDANVTVWQQISDTLQATTGIASGAFQIYAGGAGYVTGSLSIANSLFGVIKESNAQYTKGGDGLTSSVTGTIFDTPFYAQLSRSVSNSEKEHARLFGAVFDSYQNNLDYIFSRPLLGSGSLTQTYIVADLCVDNIPASARDLIVSTFARGVYLNKLESSNV